MGFSVPEPYAASEFKEEWRLNGTLSRKGKFMEIRTMLSDFEKCSDVWQSVSKKLRLQVYINKYA